MDLTQLKALGGLVSEVPEKRKVTWTPTGRTEPVTADVYIRRRSFGSLETTVFADTDDKRARMASLVSATVLLGNDPDKLEPMDYATAYQLDPPLGNALLALSGQINEMVEGEEKK